MDTELLRRWNARVSPEDTVYLLGDFCFGPKENVAKYRAQLQGRVVLIRGNHDRNKGVMLAAGFAEVHDQLILPTPHGSILLRHKPHQDDWRALSPGLTAHLCGHVHNEFHRRGDLINVGVDVNDFEPKTLEELLAVPQDPVL